MGVPTRGVLAFRKGRAAPVTVLTFAIGLIVGLVLAGIVDHRRWRATVKLLPKLRRRYGTRQFTALEVEDDMCLDGPPNAELRALVLDGLLIERIEPDPDAGPTKWYRVTT